MTLSVPNPTYFICDLETSGTDEHETDLLTLWGAVLDEQFNIIDTIDLAVKPKNKYYRVEAEAMGVNKINLAQHDKVALSYEAGVRRLANFLSVYARVENEVAKNKLVFCGHNCPFDRKYLRAFLSQQVEETFFERHSLDTGAIARFLLVTGRLPKEVGSSLPRLMKHYGVHFGAAGAHNAEADTRATLEVLVKMIEGNRLISIVSNVESTS